MFRMVVVVVLTMVLNKNVAVLLSEVVMVVVNMNVH